MGEWAIDRVEVNGDERLIGETPRKLRTTFELAEELHLHESVGIELDDGSRFTGTIVGKVNKTFGGYVYVVEYDNAR